MKLFKKILIATDLSDYSAEAVEYAVSLANVCGGSVTLFHVFEPPFLDQTGFNFAMGPEVYEWVGGVRGQAEKKLGTLARDIRKRGVDVSPVIRDGNPTAEILKEVEKENPDLIVMGTHGRIGFSHALLGSVAERVLRRAECPVLTIHPKKIAA